MHLAKIEPAETEDQLLFFLRYFSCTRNFSLLLLLCYISLLQQYFKSHLQIVGKRKVLYRRSFYKVEKHRLWSKLSPKHQAGHCFESFGSYFTYTLSLTNIRAETRGLMFKPLFSIYITLKSDSHFTSEKTC